MNSAFAICGVVPVVLFYVASFVMLYDFYKEMSKGTYTALACGMLMICIGGTARGIYTILYYCGVCDFRMLGAMFFPLLSIGFTMAGAALFAHIYFLHPKLKHVTLAVAPAVFDGTMVFVSLTVFGMFGFFAALIRRAVQRRKPAVVVLYAVSLAAFALMGLLVNWQLNGFETTGAVVCANLAAQSALLGAVLSMHHARTAEEFREKMAAIHPLH